MNLIKNPLIKIVGIAFIVYFALFYNSENKNSLRNRLTVNQIKNNINNIQNLPVSQISEEQNILDNDIDINQNLSETSTEEDSSLKKGNNIITYKDIDKGEGKKVGCGDIGTVNLIQSYGGKVFYKKNFELNINNSPVNQQLIGMKEGGKRRVIIADKVNIEDVKMIYEIKLIKISNKSKENKNCN